MDRMHAGGGAIFLDWQLETARGTLGWSIVVRHAAEAARMVEGVARNSRNGEYRVSLPGSAPVYTSAALVRAWREEGGHLPRALSASLWRREVERAAELEKLIAALRSLLGSAARKGLVPQAAVAEIVQVVRTTTDGMRNIDDVAHGPLSR